MKLRSRNFMYTQQTSRLPDTIDNIVNRVKAAGATDIAWIEQTEDGTPHIHLIFKFKNARTLKAVVKIIGDLDRQVTVWDSRWYNAVSYLVHATFDAQKKAKYDYSAIHANFDVKKVLEKTAKNAKTGAVTKAINSYGDSEITADELLDKIGVNAWFERRYEIAQKRNLLNRKKDAIFRAEMQASDRKVKAVGIASSSYGKSTQIAVKVLKKLCSSVAIATPVSGFFSDYNDEHSLVVQLPSSGYIHTHSQLKGQMQGILASNFSIPQTVTVQHEKKYIMCEYIIFNIYADEYESKLSGGLNPGGYLDTQAMHEQVRNSVLEHVHLEDLKVPVVRWTSDKTSADIEKSVKKILTDSND